MQLLHGRRGLLSSIIGGSPPLSCPGGLSARAFSCAGADASRVVWFAMSSLISTVVSRGSWPQGAEVLLQQDDVIEGADERHETRRRGSCPLALLISLWGRQDTPPPPSACERARIAASTARRPKRRSARLDRLTVKVTTNRSPSVVIAAIRPLPRPSTDPVVAARSDVRPAVRPGFPEPAVGGALVRSPVPAPCRSVPFRVTAPVTWVVTPVTCPAVTPGDSA